MTEPPWEVRLRSGRPVLGKEEPDPLYLPTSGKTRFRAILCNTRPRAEQEENMRRIALCVNACDGLPAEALDAGYVRLAVRLVRELFGKTPFSQERIDQLNGEIAECLRRLQQ